MGNPPEDTSHENSHAEIDDSHKIVISTRDIADEAEFGAIQNVLLQALKIFWRKKLQKGQAKQSLAEDEVSVQYA